MRFLIISWSTTTTWNSSESLAIANMSSSLRTFKVRWSVARHLLNKTLIPFQIFRFFVHLRFFNIARWRNCKFTSINMIETGSRLLSSINLFRRPKFDFNAQAGYNLALCLLLLYRTGFEVHVHSQRNYENLSIRECRLVATKIWNSDRIIVNKIPQNTPLCF